MRLHALTVQQPWALAIFELGKDVENRTQATRHRGPLAIHAGQGWDAAGWAWMVRSGVCGPRGRDEFRAAAKATHGAVLGVVDVTDVTPAHEAQPFTAWATGPWCWHLKNARRLRPTWDLHRADLLGPVPQFVHPVKVAGQLGLWRLSEADTEMVLRGVELNR